MKFSQLPIKDQILTVIILAAVWFLGTVLGCILGILLSEGVKYLNG